MPEKVKSKAKSTKKTATASTNKKKKKKANLNRLLSEMTKLSVDANDREICKRFKAIMDSSNDDITKVALDGILKNTTGIDISNYHESLHPYIKHYIYMVKRSKTEKT